MKVSRKAAEALAKGRRPAISEAEFQSQVIGLARHLGWLVAHFRCVRVQRRDGSAYYQTPVQADGAGFVDLVLCRERIIWAELKAAGGRLSPEQEAWVARLRAAGCEVYVWRPSDWPDIERLLARD